MKKFRKHPVFIKKAPPENLENSTWKILENSTWKITSLTSTCLMLTSLAVLADIEEGWCTPELTETDGFRGGTPAPNFQFQW